VPPNLKPCRFAVKRLRPGTKHPGHMNRTVAAGYKTSAGEPAGRLVWQIVAH
jgi:hypothetical protein